MKEIKIENVIIELEEPPKFFKFKPRKIYEVEVDLQRFPVTRKFRNREGKEYPALVYNIRVLKENGKVANTEWMLRKIGVGDYREYQDEDRKEIRIRPRKFSEAWQLAVIYDEFGAGIHKCIVTTREGNQGQVLMRFIHSKDCECLKSKKEQEIEEEKKGSEELRIYHPQEIAENLKEEIKEERVITVKEVAEQFNIDEDVARKALEILKEQGLAVKIREDKYYLSPKLES